MLPKKYVVRSEGNVTGILYFQEKYNMYLKYNPSREYFGEDETGYIEVRYDELFLPFFKDYRILSYRQFEEMIKKEEKEENILELTLEEIAQKFNIDVKQLKVKK